MFLWYFYFSEITFILCFILWCELRIQVLKLLYIVFKKIYSLINFKNRLITRTVVLIGYFISTCTVTAWYNI